MKPQLCFFSSKTFSSCNSTFVDNIFNNGTYLNRSIWVNVYKWNVINSNLCLTRFRYNKLSTYPLLNNLIDNVLSHSLCP